MEHLQAFGWRTLTLDELLAGYAKGEWPERTFALTFDDGFENFAEHGLRILAACGFTATVFVVVNWVGRTNDWPGQPAWVSRRALLDWNGLRSIADAGMEIGGHSLSHAHLISLSREESVREICDCKCAIEDRIGRPVRAFAYPYGETSSALEEIVADAFCAGFGTRLGFATVASGTAAFERIDAYYLREARYFRAIESGWFDAYLSVRRWARDIRRLKRRLA